MKLLLLFTLLFSISFAQSYEEYLRSQEEAFSSYKEERDKKFSDFLNKEWKAYKQSQGLKSYEEDKPKTIPTAKKRKIIPVKEKTIVVIKPIKKSLSKPLKKIIIPPESEKLKTLYMTYFGVDLQVHYDNSILMPSMHSISKTEIKRAWDSLAKSNYEVTIKELNEVSRQLQLNDWARYLLVKQLSSKLYRHDNDAIAFSWFVLLKMGYDAHIAYQQHRLILLLPVKGELYSTVHYSLGSKQYYAIDYYAKGKLGSIMTYEHAYKGSNKSIDFSLNKLPLFSPDIISKRFSFKPSRKLYSLTLNYDKHLLNFYQTYPQVNYKNYFFASHSTLLDESVKKEFKTLLVGKSQSEALDILLNFVQNAFHYKVDEEQFNREKVMFASETLYYPYSDCEDRAILFAYLVQTLLGMEVIGLKYPNHMATAVKMDEKIKGEYIEVNKSAYVVADPTYINASLGVSMPEYRGKKSYEIVSTGGEK